MYNENEFISVRDRINNELLKRGVDVDRRQDRVLQESKINCKGEEISRPFPERKSFGLEGYPLASVYSPIQTFRDLYEPEEALKAGTLFKELDLPFMAPEEGKGGGCCGKQ